MEAMEREPLDRRPGVISMVAVAICLSACNHGAREARRLATSCSGGSAAACDTLGQQVARGDHVLRDWRRAGALYRQACDGEMGDGCLRLAGLHVDSRGREHGVALDSMSAVHFLDRACDLGTTQGCVELGDMYLERDSVVAGADSAKPAGPRQDIPRAIGLFQRACDGDGMAGCDRLGLLYRDGTGVTADPPRAVDLFRRACGSGYQVGCAHLGEAYVAGSGVAADPGRAATLFEKACETAMVGCFDLAGLLESGSGVAQDQARAATLYQKACDGTRTRDGGSAPVAESCFRLANMYANATGVERNLGQASRLFYRACSLGYEEACRKRS
jgi:hypothetical protein